jgi:hypothetical protein
MKHKIVIEIPPYYIDTLRSGFPKISGGGVNTLPTPYQHPVAMYVSSALGTIVKSPRDRIPKTNVV